ncbi:MAG: hypothetical protein ABR62_03155, partial [Actinobacteria bacterium BACL2 MAG-120820-bin50]
MPGFGFTPDNGDEQEPEGNNPFGFENFGEIFKQFSGMGLNLPALMASLSGQASPASLSKEMIRDISRKYLSAHGEVPVTVEDLTQIQEAINIADLWINEATTFPSLPLTDSIALSRRDWIDSTLNGWQELTKPLVDSMSGALSSMLDQGLGEQGEDNGISIPGFGPMSISKSSINAIMATFMSSLISTQLGQSIGALSTTVTGANDVALPLSKDIKAQLLPQNVRAWGSGLEIQEGEIRIYLALREIAAARLFKQSPWLSGYIAEVISAYGSGIRIDISAITQSAQDAMDSGAIDPSNPESMASALSGGLFTPETTASQSAALEKLETLLALIEGWIDAVVVKAASDRLPSLIKLRETQVRRRAT